MSASVRKTFAPQIFSQILCEGRSGHDNGNKTCFLYRMQVLFPACPDSLRHPKHNFWRPKAAGEKQNDAKYKIQIHLYFNNDKYKLSLLIYILTQGYIFMLENQIYSNSKRELKC